MFESQTRVARHLEALADKVVFASIPFLGVFMALALIKAG
jgi:hypothetical protein